MATNDWCDVLGIERPDLAAVKDHREANTNRRRAHEFVAASPPTTSSAQRRFARSLDIDW